MAIYLTKRVETGKSLTFVKVSPVSMKFNYGFNAIISNK